MVPFDYPRRSRDMLDRFMNVDIASIGGKPTDSRIDGEKGVQVSVGGHPNSTVAEEAEKAKIEKAKYAAYYRSGEVALVIVVIAAAAWGWFVWRDRRKRAGYQGLFGGSSQYLPTINGTRFRDARGHMSGRNVEAGDFDEGELDDLHVTEPREEPRERYSIGGESSDDDIGSLKKGTINGHAEGGKPGKEKG
ncbi:MAG: hypothetical protein Q9204_008229 [Flavoplaca sp. TL-2023a]